MVTPQSILKAENVLHPSSCCTETIKEVKAFTVQWYWICKSWVETEGVQQILIITDYYNVWNSFAVLEAIKSWVLLHWRELACIVVCFLIWFEAYLRFSLANSWSGSCFLSVRAYTCVCSVNVCECKFTPKHKDVHSAAWITHQSEITHQINVDFNNKPQPVAHSDLSLLNQVSGYQKNVLKELWVFCFTATI